MALINKQERQWIIQLANRTIELNPNHEKIDLLKIKLILYLDDANPVGKKECNEDIKWIDEVFYK